MKHNFPEGVSIGCTHVHNLKEGKEILHLAIDGSCKISTGATEKIADKDYPRFCWDNIAKELCETSDEVGNKDYIWVSFAEFKEFLKGKSKYKTPFKETLKLSNDFTATITKENVKVGCQTFTHNTIKLLYQLSLKAQKS